MPAWAFVMLLAIGGLSGCSHASVDRTDTPVRTIVISDIVNPETLYAHPGEEVRWKNDRDTPVRVGFLTMRLLDEVGCEKGMATIFGHLADLVTIPPGESVSLCLVRSGDLKYNVWFDADNPKGAISRTAIVRIQQGG